MQLFLLSQLCFDFFVSAESLWPAASSTVSFLSADRRKTSVCFFFHGVAFERHLRANAALHHFLQNPGGQMNCDEGPAGRQQPVPPEPALGLHSAGPRETCQRIRSVKEKRSRCTTQWPEKELQPQTVSPQFQLLLAGGEAAGGET